MFKQINERSRAQNQYRCACDSLSGAFFNIRRYDVNMIRVALYYPTQLGLWQDVIRGVFRFARPEQPWVFSLATTQSPGTLLKWNPDAVIGQFEHSDTARQFQKLKIPIVDTSYSFAESRIPRVRFDDNAIGAVAAEYFLARGFRKLGFVGRRRILFESERGIGFHNAIRQRGIEVLDVPDIDTRSAPVNQLGPVSARFRNWLNKQAGPAALFAAIDPLAFRIAELCRDLRISVPDKVALLGANDDQLICQLASPHLSSVRLPAESLGYAAANLLARWLNTGRRPKKEVVLQPAGVITRQSTDIYATEDELLQQALRQMRDMATERVTVDEIVRKLNVSRRQIERTFQRELGRSPLSELQRIRIERAKQQLIETDDAMPRIAASAGFRDAKHLALTFRRHTGTTPTEFRKKYR